MAKKRRRKNNHGVAVIIALVVVLIVLAAVLVYITVFDKDKKSNSCSDKNNISDEKNDKDAPVITLASDTISAIINQEIRAKGVSATIEEDNDYILGFVDSETDSADKMKESVKYDKAGEYSQFLLACDTAGNTSRKKITIKVSDKIDYLNNGATVSIKENSDFTEFDTKTIPFGFGTEMDEKNRPTGCQYYVTKYGKYAADFIQPDSKYVFLTFDEGYEYGNTPDILDTLKEKNAKAVFFVTLPFVKDNPDLVKRMLTEGHVVGNHTVTHPSNGLSTLSVADQINEIKTVHQYMLDNYDYEMYLFRFPTGAFSEQSLAIVQSLGYRSVFWSFAHKDWDVNDQPDVKESLDKALTSVHGGEIFLLHGVSTTDTKMLPDLIDGIRAKGYETGYYSRTDF